MLCFSTSILKRQYLKDSRKVQAIGNNLSKVSKLLSCYKRNIENFFSLSHVKQKLVCIGLKTSGGLRVGVFLVHACFILMLVLFSKVIEIICSSKLILYLWRCVCVWFCVSVYTHLGTNLRHSVLRLKP